MGSFWSVLVIATRQFVMFATTLAQSLGYDVRPRIALVGLDNAGRATLYHCVHGTERYKGFRWKYWSDDLVSLFKHEEMKDRAKLRGNYEGFAAVIFVIDSMERSRFPEARIYLHAWLGHETALDTPILIMANKQDLPGAATAEEVSEALELKQALAGRREDTWRIEPVSVGYNQNGLRDAVDWLVGKVSEK
mmetsp:Transcript_8185/g.19372  ORF Transcript_8185/g.19372 Transcript_8185/m.19372 type:complete len:192 (+) Transcript_8185:230-805(+)